MAEEETTLKRTGDPSQETDLVRGVRADVAKILTPNEEVLYIASQNATAMTPRPDCVVATTNRVILYRQDILGRVNFADFLWQDVKNSHIEQGALSSRFLVETIDGRKEVMNNLDKDQAKRLYSVCQQMDQEWREKRRVRTMEEERARAGGIYMAPPDVASPTAGEDPVDKLAKAKAMLDKGLISEIEYEALKAKILSSL